MALPQVETRSYWEESSPSRCDRREGEQFRCTRRAYNSGSREGERLLLDTEATLPSIFWIILVVGAVITIAFGLILTHEERPTPCDNDCAVDWHDSLVPLANFGNKPSLHWRCKHSPGPL
jgi:hypothetical protein